jgi:hypothetical protein
MFLNQRQFTPMMHIASCIPSFFLGFTPLLYSTAALKALAVEPTHLLELLCHCTGVTGLGL